MALKPSTVHSHFSGRDIRPMVLSAQDVADVRTVADLHLLGIDIGDAAMVAQMQAALDAAPNIQPAAFGGGMATPAQFFQAWLPGFVRTVTTARTIDKLLGKTTAGDWEDEEVIQGVMEPTGLAQLYGDHTNIPLASWGTSYERRTIIRFEEGLRVGVLEDLRAAKGKVNDAAVKRAAAAMALDIQRNRVGFYGFNGGANRTYGFLNDPSLPAYVNVSGGVWSAKTYLQITADIRVAIGALIGGAGGLVTIDTPMVLALPLGSDIYLSVTSDYGNSVRAWLTENYPNLRIEIVPELTAANGGANVFYLYVERIDDGESDDGGQTIIQVVPTSFKTLGVEKGAKFYLEDYSNATAGVMVKRPYLVKRYSGI